MFSKSKFFLMILHWSKFAVNETQDQQYYY